MTLKELENMVDGAAQSITAQRSGGRIAAGPGYPALHGVTVKLRIKTAGGAVKVIRVFRSQNAGGRLCVFRRRSTRYGHIMTEADAAEIISAAPVASQTQCAGDKWRKSWQNVARRLALSGLWPDVLKQINTGLSIGYGKIKAAEKTEAPAGMEYAEAQKYIDAQRAAIDARIVSDTWYLYHMSGPARVKSMYFGRWSGHKEKMAAIKNALKDKKETRITGRASYDVTYNYEPKTARAWYSEEFKGCGNGHYYLAIDATGALFYETD